jgi:hypothetical protein
MCLRNDEGRGVTIKTDKGKSTHEEVEKEQQVEMQKSEVRGSGASLESDPTSVYKV